MTRVVTITSAKGGVGKTTMTSNLGLALTQLGKSTIILDGNITTPNLGLHLGISLFPKTLHDVLKGKAKLHEAVYTHPTGLRVIPAGLSLEDLRGVNTKEFPKVISSLMGSAEIVLIDCAAGIGKETMLSLEVADDVIVVTNPELPAVTDALKVIKLSQELNLHIAGVVVNRRKGVKHELTNREIESMLEIPIIAEVPEDESVPEAIAAKTPVVHHKPHADASYQIRNLAADLIGVEAVHPQRNFWQRIFGIY